MINFEHKDRYDLQDLLRIMECLRAPDGCPWDRVQTHESIRRNMLEEAYEVVDAIDNHDVANLKEELGDVLLQVVFHARMAEEEGLFDFSDVTDGICKKLLFRHPHVFGSLEAKDPDGALASWEAAKQQEKGQRTAADTLDSVARALPGLIRADKLQSKARKAGFDWDEAAPALAKLQEETNELIAAAQGDGDPAEELGDVLFAAVKAGHFLGVDSEEALHRTCEKFISRFRTMEQLTDRPLSDLELPEKEQLWNEAKRLQKSGTQDV